MDSGGGRLDGLEILRIRSRTPAQLRGRLLGEGRKAAAYTTISIHRPRLRHMGDDQRLPQVECPAVRDEQSGSRADCLTYLGSGNLKRLATSEA